MDNWRVAVLGDGGVGKTALAVQVSTLVCCPALVAHLPKFTLNCFVGELCSWTMCSLVVTRVRRGKMTFDTINETALTTTTSDI